MLLIVEKGIKGGISHSIHKYARANNKYMKNYDKDRESSYLEYLDTNNLYGWAMSQKRFVNGFECVEELSQFKEDFIKNYDEDSNKGYFLEVDVEYPKKLFNPHMDLRFLPEREKIEKYNKFVCTIQDKKNYVVHIRALKQVLNHGLILKKVDRVIQFNQEAWLKPYIDMNTKLRTEAKNDFEKDFFKLMNNAVFGNTMENVRKHRDIRSVTTDKRRNQLASEPNYYTPKYFSENLMAVEMKKARVKMNKAIYLGMSILVISKTLMYEFWHDYIKPKYQGSCNKRSCTKRSCTRNRAELCYMDTDSFIIYIKSEEFYKEIANDVEKWFDTSNYDENDKRPLPIGKNKKVIGLFKDELGAEIMKELVIVVNIKKQKEQRSV